MTRRDTIARIRDLVILALCLAGIALIAVGCSGRDERAQHAAEVGAGVDALAAEVPPERAAWAGDVRAGAKGYTAAAAGVPQDEWPAPSRTPEQIRADAKPYRQDGEQAEASIGWLGGLGIFAAIMGTLKVALSIGSRIPSPIQPMLATGNAFLGGLAGARARKGEQRARRALATTTAQVAQGWDLLEDYHPGMAAALRDQGKRVQDRLGVRDEVAAALRDELMRVARMELREEPALLQAVTEAVPQTDRRDVSEASGALVAKDSDR